jgi:hypothetical protein
MSNKDARMDRDSQKICPRCKGSSGIICYNCHGTGRKSGMMINLSQSNTHCLKYRGTGR